jgi:DNA-directed RNA polymerase subunit RPC12/RpoP
MIRFNCPHCGKKLETENKAAGRKTKCPKCSGKMSVPRPFGESSFPLAYWASAKGTGTQNASVTGSGGQAQPDVPKPPRNGDAANHSGHPSAVRKSPSRLLGEQTQPSTSPRTVKIVALLALACVVAWFVFRDTWERDHGPELRTFTVTVEIRDITVFDSSPRWSAQHELRINGRVVDKVTNTSASAQFVDVEVRAGDKINAWSGWTNAFGTVLAVFDWPDPVVAEIGKTRYIIDLYNRSD